MRNLHQSGFSLSGRAGVPKSRVWGLQAAGGLVCAAVTKPGAGVSGRAKLRNRNLIFAQEKAVHTVAAA